MSLFTGGGGFTGRGCRDDGRTVLMVPNSPRGIQPTAAKTSASSSAVPPVSVPAAAGPPTAAETTTASSSNPNPSLKLIYFDPVVLGGSPGRAEVIRMALFYCGLQYQEQLIASHEEWAEVKKTMMFGQVPALAVDELPPLVQTNSILRYIGKLGGGDLYPADAIAAARVDAIMDQASDALSSQMILKKPYAPRFG